MWKRTHKENHDFENVIAHEVVNYECIINVCIYLGWL